MDEKIEVGDVVKLRSGGPEMTVERIRPESLYCVFFDQNHELQTVTFDDPAVCQKIERPAGA